MALQIKQVCSKCNGVGYYTRGEDVIDPCNICLGAKYIITPISVDADTILSSLDAANTNIKNLTKICEKILSVVGK